jgi:hypothetical protein
MPRTLGHWTRNGFDNVCNCLCPCTVSHKTANRREPALGDLGPSTVSTAMAVEMPAPTPESTDPPSPTPDVTLAPVYAMEALTSTLKATATARPRIKHRNRRPIFKKEDSREPVREFFRSLFLARPTQTCKQKRRGSDTYGVRKILPV